MITCTTDMHNPITGEEVLTRPRLSLRIYLKLMLDGGRRDMSFSTVGTDKVHRILSWLASQ